MDTSQTEKINEFTGYFQRLWPHSKPLAKLFRTGAGNYLYDTGTNTLYACDDIEFCLLNNLFRYEIEEALRTTSASYPPSDFLRVLTTLKNLIEGNNILRSSWPVRFGGSHFDDLVDSVSNALGMIQLEVTERCNLRCAYCLYGSHYKYKRNHGTRDMHISCAEMAIDHLANSSRYKSDVAVTFYGGEPLLRVPFIKWCVAYSRKRLKEKGLKFSVTTNATLISPQTAKYFANEQISMHVSIDGPEEIHDQYRVDKRNVGSFQRTISGLKNLFDAYGDKSNLITLSMVYAPPYSMERAERVATL